MTIFLLTVQSHHPLPSGNRRNDGLRTRGKNQFVVAECLTAGAYTLVFAIYCSQLATGIKG
ncbi:hypothetical protein D3C85_1833010 [compost metagenome]